MQLVLSLTALFCFVPVSFSLGKDLFNNHVVGGCIESIKNWPKVHSVLAWVHIRRRLLD